MGQRKTRSLACGDYVSKDPKENVAVLNARLRLLDSIKRTYPKLLETLASDVFPVYAQVADKASAIYGQSHGLPLYAHLAKHPRVKSALGEWAASFNITADWLMDEAIGALWTWRRSSEEPKTLKWRPNRVLYRNAVCADEFQVRVKGWEMEIISFAAYRESVYAEVKNKIAEYELKASQEAHSRGLVRTPRTYSEANLDWFVLYQIAGMSSGEIVRRLSQKEIHTEESDLLKGVKAAAKLLRWGQLRRPNLVRK